MASAEGIPEQITATRRDVPSSGEAARASASLVHDLRGPLVTIDGFSGEIGHALAELDALLDAAAPDGEIVARVRMLLAEDLHPCLGFVGEASSELHRRIDALALPVDPSSAASPHARLATSTEAPDTGAPDGKSGP